LIEEFYGSGTMPFSLNYSHTLLGDDAFDFYTGTEFFKLAHVTFQPMMKIDLIKTQNARSCAGGYPCVIIRSPRDPTA
jgi:hypothetical protein